MKENSYLISDESLINEIEKHTVLYEKCTTILKKKKLRDEAWVTVANAMDIPKEACQIRWRVIRDRYVREKQKIESQQRNGIRSTQNWEYMPHLQFLSGHIKHRNTRFKMANTSLQSPTFLTQSYEFKSSPHTEDDNSNSDKNQVEAFKLNRHSPQLSSLDDDNSIPDKNQVQVFRYNSSTFPSPSSPNEQTTSYAFDRTTPSPSTINEPTSFAFISNTPASSTSYSQEKKTVACDDIKELMTSLKTITDKLQVKSEHQAFFDIEASLLNKMPVAKQNEVKVKILQMLEKNARPFSS
ncbi:transcription factor Adf-1-like [Teleopsis dalmanni]|uniref:transcription factor Adf-1-like n=1 Tax=Teleopsis dalmanni TaxID=139649 RepID=UPI0018CCC221|nr:transcription factor Adf-1-like [Teleopsis dalmanni]